MFELRFTCCSQVHDVERAHIGLYAADRRIADDDIPPNQRVARSGRDVQAVGVARDSVFVDEVVVSPIDHADTEIIWGIRVAVTMSDVQPDPAVLAVHSYAAARGPWGGSAVPHNCVSFHDGVERRVHHSNPGRTVGRCGEAFDACVS